MDAHLLGPNAADGRLVALQRWGKRQLARLVGLRGRTLQREVPVQLALRCILEPLLAEALVGVSASLHRAEAELMTAARQGLQPEGAAEPGAATATAQRWFDTANADLRRALLGGLNEGVALLSRVGSPGSPSRGLRFANVERQVASALTHLAEDAPQWADRCEHAEDALKAAAAVAGIGLVLRQGVDHRARGPLLATRSEILPDLDEVATRLEALAVEAAALDPAAFELDTLEQLGTRCADALSEHSAEQMKRSSARFRRRTQAGLLVQDLAEVVRTTPATTVIISRHTPVARATRPRQVHTRELNLARLVDAQLHDELLPAVARALGPVTELVAVCEERAREGVSVASYGAHLAARGGFEAPEERRAVLVDAIQRGGHRVRRLHDELRAALGDSERALDEAQQRSAERLNALLDVDGVRPDTLVRNTLRATLGEATGALRRLRDVVVARGGALAGRARAISQDKNVRDLRIRSGRERLDATAIRDYLDTHLPPAERRGLPPTYVRLMAPGPVSERRMFVAREPLLEHLLDSLRAEPARATPSTLLVGPVGAGRTSLLQMVQMHLVGPRVLWLDHAFAARGEGPLVALGTELGVSGELSLVREALRARPTVVILDAVERWVEPGQLGVAALDELFELMDATVPQTCWLMSMNDAAFVIFDEAMQLRQRVSRLITLEPLSWEALQSIIELRAQQAGFDAVYGAEGWRGRLRERLRPGREKEDYFRDLARASRGVAGDALRLHLASASPRDAHSLRFSTPALTALPFVGQLTPEVLALLGALLRFGPLDPPRMARLLGQDDAFLASRLGFLLHAGLVRLKVQSGSAIVVSPFVAHALRRELEDMAILPRSAP